MTTKVKGTEGVEFPDGSVQNSAAYSKAQSDEKNMICRASISVPFAVTDIWSVVPLDVSVIESGITRSGNTIVIPKDGIYQITCAGSFTLTSDAALIGLSINGTFYIVYGGQNASGFGLRINATEFIQLNTGDVIRLLVQRGGTPCNLTADPSTFVSVSLYK